MSQARGEEGSREGVRGAGTEDVYYGAAAQPACTLL